MQNLLILMILACLMQSLLAFDGASDAEHVDNRRTSWKPQLKRLKYKVTTCDDENCGENLKENHRLSSIGPVHVYNLNHYPTMSMGEESRPLISTSQKALMKKMLKRMQHQAKDDHERHKIFIYASLPKSACQCNETETAKDEHTMSTVHPLYDSFASIPTLKPNKRIVMRLRRVKNRKGNRKNAGKKSNSQINALEGENNISDKVVDADNSKMNENSAQIKDEDMQAAGTITFEQIVHPDRYANKQKITARPVYLKNYLPIMPITAESMSFKPKQKREKAFEQRTLANRLKNYKNMELEATFAKRQSKNLRKNNYRQRAASKTRGYLRSNRDARYQTSEEDYVETAQSAEYVKNKKGQMFGVNNKFIEDDSLESSKPTPRSVYLNKIVKKRCNHDSLNMKSHNLKKSDDSFESYENDVRLRSHNYDVNDSNGSNDFLEDKFGDEEDVTDDYITATHTNTNNGIMCKNSSNKNGNNGGGSFKCGALRPAFRELYGYEQHLTK